jgi:dienelactone hydrolase
MKKLVYVLFSLFLSLSAEAKIISKLIAYKQGGTALEGYLAFDDGKAAHRPGIVVVHDWMGISDDTKKRADMLAELGYVAFAADIYGKGVRPKDATEAGKLATQYKSDVKLLRARVQAALEVLESQPQVDKSKLAAIGYCFGGTTALELARSGAPLKGVVSFHGGLATPNPADAKNIKGRILALHGADDPYVNAAEVQGFEKEMRDAHVDWQLTAYGNAVHAFTVKAAGTDNSKGAAYNEKADKRSWVAMQEFFKEIF